MINDDNLWIVPDKGLFTMKEFNGSLVKCWNSIEVHMHYLCDQLGVERDRANWWVWGRDDCFGFEVILAMMHIHMPDGTTREYDYEDWSPMTHEWVLSKVYPAGHERRCPKCL